MKKAFFSIFIFLIFLGFFVFPWHPAIEIRPTSRVIQIVGKGSLEICGMGWILSDGYILTSAHVVADDRLLYTADIGGNIEKLTLQDRDLIRDRALLQYGISTTKNITYPNIQNIQIGQTVVTHVDRSGALVTLTGAITSITGSILGYTQAGETMYLSGIVLTDLPVLPGDSGAPILDLSGNLVDVVHVRGGR